MVAAALRGTGARGAVTADAGLPPLRSRQFDVVLLDAPCSGTGTLRRHPEIKWRLELTDLERVVDAQRRLIEAACELVADDGALVYATCSVEPEENEGHFEAARPEFRTVDAHPHLPSGCPALRVAGGGVRIPPNLESDGFTVHVLRRTVRSADV